MAAFIRQLDANHLIADGGEGFDDDPSLYPGISNRYTVSGSEGFSFHRGKLVGEIATGKAPSVDLAPFRPDRF